MNSDDEFFWRAVERWRDSGDRTVPPELMELALHRGRTERARAAHKFFGRLFARRRAATTKPARRGSGALGARSAV